MARTRKRTRIINRVLNLNKNELRSYGKYLQFGIHMGLSMVIPVLGGFWLDKKLDTFPWMLITGVALGLFSAGWSVYKLVYELELEDKKNKKQKK
jgi:F0F1-type ATP synthase assembly protein I